MPGSVRSEGIDSDPIEKALALGLVDGVASVGQRVIAAAARVAKGLGGYFQSKPSSPPTRAGRNATKTIILHIGLPKSGSTALQGFLQARRDELRAHDVYYPLTGQIEWEPAHHK